ncbi:MAG: hypothetical protein AAFY57_02765 [Cyanobacteria bacterium J06642_2]
MNLRQALEQLERAPRDSTSPLQALKQLHEVVTAALQCHLQGESSLAQQHLNAALPQWVRATQALSGEIYQSEDAETASLIDVAQCDRKTIHINRNRAEVRVNDELRGSWSIWTIADLKEVCRLAEEFDCGLVYSSISAFAAQPKCQFPPSA